MMNRNRQISLKVIVLFTLFSFLAAPCFAEDIQSLKQDAYVLYATKNFDEAYNILDNLPLKEKDEEVFLMLANIAEESGDDNLAIQNLNKSIDKNCNYYKAYYNLGCILARKKSYLLAMNNFELAIKNHKNFASAYYNLACCQIQMRNYETAKKNLLKAIELEPANKDYYYNLALCYKELNKKGAAKRALKTYESIK